MFTLVSGFRLNPFPIRFVFLHVYVEIRKYLEPMFSKHYYSLIGLQLFNVSIHCVYTIWRWHLNENITILSEFCIENRTYSFTDCWYICTVSIYNFYSIDITIINVHSFHSWNRIDSKSECDHDTGIIIVKLFVIYHEFLW